MKEMQAGREMDALVAERVMGWFWIRYNGSVESTCEGKIEAFLANQENWVPLFGGGVVHRGRQPKYILDDGKYPRRGGGHGSVPCYSTDIAAALTVWQKLRESGVWCCLQIGSDYHYCWDVRLTRANLDEGAEHKPEVSLTFEGGLDALAHGICLAALAALGGDLRGGRK